MSADVNIKIIKDVYDAFGRGDVAAVHDAIADVHAVVRIRATSRATGKSLAMNLHHFFTLRDGKIAYYRGTEDTAQTEAALRA